MRGLIFTEFLKMVEDQHGYALVDQIISGSNLPNDGAYTSVGVYPHEELFRLITELSVAVNVPIQKLIKDFGELLFSKFASSHTMYISEDDTVFKLLSKLENFIHVEVKKLHPESDLPTFDTLSSDGEKLVLVYKSKKGLASLAEGLMCGCITYFNENIVIEKRDLSNGKGTEVEFLLTKIDKNG